MSITGSAVLPGSRAELLNLRQHAQELVDENDALKLTVHRLNVELSRYQTFFRPLSKQESSRISGLPKTGSPPPWLLDMKYLSPLVLAYEDRMNENDALRQTTEEEVKRLRVHVEAVVQENERLHGEIAKTEGVSQKNCHQLQQQALLVLQENQVLIDQLEAQHVKAKAGHSRRHSEVSKVSKKLMLLEAENQRLQEVQEESRKELQKKGREAQVLQARLKDAVTWDEHCNIAGKLRRQLEQQESQNKSEMDELLLRLSSLQEENMRLALDKANLTADIKRMEAEQDLTKQANRKAERRVSVLKRQKEDCVLKEEKTRQYMGAVISVAEHISLERDQLLQMASVLQQEKQGFVSRILNGTLRFGKLQEEVKVSFFIQNITFTRPRLPQTYNPILPQYHPDTTRYYPNTTPILPRYHPILPRYHPDTTPILPPIPPRYYPRYHPDTTPDTTPIPPRYYPDTTPIPPRYYPNTIPIPPRCTVGSASDSIVCVCGGYLRLSRGSWYMFPWRKRLRCRAPALDLSRIDKWDMMIASSGRADNSYSVTSVWCRQKGQEMKPVPSAMSKILTRQRTQTRWCSLCVLLSLAVAHLLSPVDCATLHKLHFSAKPMGANQHNHKVFNVYFSVVNSWLSSHIWLFRLVSSQLISQLIDASCRQRAWQPQRAVQPRLILSVRVA
ncbi:Centrosomal protein [Liparis tanakae]|uniref:Centrosomal protein n=1 Tax=Liparis tanakae TaxID=230148 RepID=A0A4Z2HRL6_9TELE|nr:Centrosomal protein [Liparis tanakae]